MHTKLFVTIWLCVHTVSEASSADIIVNHLFKAPQKKKKKRVAIPYMTSTITIVKHTRFWAKQLGYKEAQMEDAT